MTSQRRDTPFEIRVNGVYLKGQIFYPEAIEKHQKPTSPELSAGSSAAKSSSHCAPSGIILINNATGVPARFYTSFGRWAADFLNSIVLTWDYRDFGASGNPRGSRATMLEWGIEDATAVRHWLKREYSELPLWVIGHSLGGLTLPFQPNLDQISRVTTVASGPVHLSDHPPLHRLAIGSMWFGHGAVLTAMLGHFPGRHLGLGADIPGPAFWQWRRWSSQRGSVLSDPAAPPLLGHHLIAPVTTIAFSDDALVPPPAVWRLAEWLPSANITRRLITPNDFGLKKIGHVSAFSRKNKSLWPELVRSTLVENSVNQSKGFS
jgi:predicted alpha/beta hydrolase